MKNKKHSPGLQAGLFVLASVASVSAQAAPSGVPREWIVRFREPQNSVKQARRMAVENGAQSLIRAQLLNEPEGLVKLSFATDAQARAAREALERSGQVVSIAPNLLYKKAVRYHFRPLRPEDQAAHSSLPFFNLLEGLSQTWDDPVAAVKAVIPDVLLPPSSPATGADPLLATDWAVAAVGMNRVLDLKAAPSVTTAVIDTGVDYNHEDLISAMWRKPGTPEEVGYDFAHKNAKPFDVVQFDMNACLADSLCRIGFGAERFLVNPGHGTHCAGHVAAVQDNALGMRGMGSGASIMALKFFYDAGEAHAGQGDDAAAIQTIDYAIQNGAKVINASWGARQERLDAGASELKKAFERAQKAGVLVVVAAGNDGIDQDQDNEPTFPAAYDMDNLIVVAATDSKDQLAKFSNYGAKSVHIAAPGVGILSTVPGGRYSQEITRFKNPRTNEEQVMHWDGTSMAAPIVAGAAALIWSQHPGENYVQIRDRILKSARKVAGLDGKVLTGGVLDMAAALGR